MITASAAWTTSSVMGLGNSFEMSIPISASASTAAGLISSPGALPAERTCTRPLAAWSSSAAAIWLRPALWVHTNSTSGTSLPSLPSAWAIARSLSRAKRWAKSGT